MAEVFLDGLLDSLKVFPFLFLMYAVIEFLEHRTKITRQENLLRGGIAPLLGAATGIVPQCGFSVMAAKLYDKKLIRTGTVLAVFLATSDEALIILLSEGTRAFAVMPIIAIKFVFAAAVGYAVNGLLRREKLCDLEEDEEVHGTACGQDHEHDSRIKRYLVHPLLHSLEIFVYILIVNIAFGLLLYWVGEDTLSETLQSGYWFQPLVAAAIGLIPNCASSVVITQTYILGGLSFGGCIAGLCANAGLGFVILFKNTRQWKRNLLLVLVLFGLSMAIGYIVSAVMVCIG